MPCREKPWAEKDLGLGKSSPSLNLSQPAGNPLNLFWGIETISDQDFKKGDQWGFWLGNLGDDLWQLFQASLLLWGWKFLYHSLPLALLFFLFISFLERPEKQIHCYFLVLNKQIGSGIGHRISVYAWILFIPVLVLIATAIWHYSNLFCSKWQYFFWCHFIIFISTQVQ